MIRFLLKRICWMALTLWIVFTISFFLMRAAPGGPFDQERKLDPAVKRNVEKQYHLDKPLAWQYADRLWHAVQLDLGPSTRLQDYTVNQVIAAGFPVSASLGILALSFGLTLGLTYREFADTAPTAPWDDRWGGAAGGRRLAILAFLERGRARGLDVVGDGG